MMVNATTPFARLQQFAGRLYGPLIAYGLAWWHGADSNYWGHNAIIRTRAFAEHAGLPVLPRPAPIGGHILSHDFVEAALMRRGGWAIHMAPALGGSYEESPPSLTEYAARDRRWCQGNLQHTGVLPSRGLYWISRLHLLDRHRLIRGGAAVAVVSLRRHPDRVAGAVHPAGILPENLHAYPQWPAQDPIRAAWVFAGTMGMLLAPKLLGWLAMLADRTTRRGFGGAPRAFAGMLFEIVVSGLIAPVMMLIQSASVAGILMAATPVECAAARRRHLAVARRAAPLWPAHAVRPRAAIAAYGVSFSLFAWMTPVIVGLILAIPLAQWSASPAAGLRLRRLKLLVIPEETEPPAVLTRANALAAEFARPEGDKDGLRRLFADPALLVAHRAMLPAPRPARAARSTPRWWSVLPSWTTARASRRLATR